MTRDVVKSTIQSRPLHTRGQAQPNVVHRDPLTCIEPPFAMVRDHEVPPAAQTSNRTSQARKNGVDNNQRVCEPPDHRTTRPPTSPRQLGGSAKPTGPASLGQPCHCHRTASPRSLFLTLRHPRPSSIHAHGCSEDTRPGDSDGLSLVRFSLGHALLGSSCGQGSLPPTQRALAVSVAWQMGRRARTDGPRTEGQRESEGQRLQGNRRKGDFQHIGRAWKR